MDFRLSESTDFIVADNDHLKTLKNVEPSEKASVPGIVLKEVEVLPEIEEIKNPFNKVSVLEKNFKEKKNHLDYGHNKSNRMAELK